MKPPRKIDRARRLRRLDSRLRRALDELSPESRARWDGLNLDELGLDELEENEHGEGEADDEARESGGSRAPD